MAMGQLVTTHRIDIPQSTGTLSGAIHACHRDWEASYHAVLYFNCLVRHQGMFPAILFPRIQYLPRKDC